MSKLLSDIKEQIDNLYSSIIKFVEKENDAQDHNAEIHDNVDFDKEVTFIKTILIMSFYLKTEEIIKNWAELKKNEKECLKELEKHIKNIDEWAEVFDQLNIEWRSTV